MTRRKLLIVAAVVVVAAGGVAAVVLSARGEPAAGPCDIPASVRESPVPVKAGIEVEEKGFRPQDWRAWVRSCATPATGSPTGPG
ncbi:hypothetical protein Amsp01_026290 [Amycolatopsis sp. NBRC 101858]|nr:hypothetical protein Amsp01_026290 [Amycolatopsis sp. NBRC 101858]